MHPKTSATLLSLITLGVSEAVQADLMPQSGDAIFFTLGNQVQVKGPVYQARGGVSDAVQYLGELTGLVLAEADRLASFWLEEGNPESYVSFLVGALTVPLHESRLQHYRRLDREQGRCVEAMNSGASLAKAGSRAVQLFRSTAKQGAAPIMPDCATFRADEPALQLLGSFDALSTGLMQINYVAHPDYLPNGDFLSIPKTIRRGLEQYMLGFKALVERPDSFDCVKGARDGEIDYAKVIRGAWSGAYNSGNLKQSCRFTSQTNRWARSNDVPFARELGSVIDAKAGFYARRLGGRAADPYRKIAGTFFSIGGGASLEQIRFEADSIHRDLSGAPSVGEGPAGTIPANKARPIARGVVDTARGGRLNVRARPSTESRIRGALGDGAPVSVYARFRAGTDRTGWVAISPARDRWIHARFLKAAR
jgi:hypothetical protein